jgi:membrane-associated protease RseP (regulator of RpoE activity)
MRKYVLASIALVPLLFSFSHAAQSWSVNHPDPQSFIFSSEDGGSNSYLGIDIADVTGERLATLKLKEEKGVEVTMVDQDAPAGKAGIKEHDVIMTMNGASVESAAQLRRMIHETPAGRLITLGLSRDGQPLTVKVQLADRHSEFPGMSHLNNYPVVVPNIDVHIPEIDMPSINMVVVSQSARSGLTVENMTPQLGEFFGVKNGQGVLVRAVEKGSRADKAGFHAGDVIVKINDQPVHDTSDFTHAVRSRNGSAINVGVMRDRKEQNLNLTLPERRESGDLFEESFDEDGQVLDADSVLDLSKLNEELAQLRPDIELAKQQAADTARKTMDEARKSLCQAQREQRHASEKMQREFRKQQEQLKKGLEQMTREFRNRLDI